MLKNTAQLFGFALLTLVIASPQTPAPKAEKKTGSKMTDAQKIALAVSAGPAEIAKNATIIDMMDMSTPPKQLRAGTNGWACYAMALAPMCLDKEWQKWAEAWMSKGQLKISSTGIAYM